MELGGTSTIYYILVRAQSVSRNGASGDRFQRCLVRKRTGKEQDDRMRNTRYLKSTLVVQHMQAKKKRRKEEKGKI